jgi:hypothetical protein
MIMGVVIMKTFVFLMICCALLIPSCETLTDIEQGASKISGTMSKGAAAGGSASSLGSVDFRKDEVLCSVSGNEAQEKARYLPAVILTAPTAATGNQAEVMYPDGKKDWTYIVLPSRKANDADLLIGESVLYMYHQSDDEDMTQEKYRNNSWIFGTVTSTDEMFKGVVEVDGRPMLVKWVRIAQ